MAVKLGDAYVEISARMDKLEAGLAQAERKTQSWTSNIGGFMTNALSFAAGSVITAGIGASVACGGSYTVPVFCNGSAWIIG